MSLGHKTQKASELQRLKSHLLIPNWKSSRAPNSICPLRPRWCARLLSKISSTQMSCSFSPLASQKSPFTRAPPIRRAPKYLYDRGWPLIISHCVVKIFHLFFAFFYSRIEVHRHTHIYYYITFYHFCTPLLFCGFRLRDECMCTRCRRARV